MCRLEHFAETFAHRLQALLLQLLYSYCILFPRPFARQTVIATARTSTLFLATTVSYPSVPSVHGYSDHSSFYTHIISPGNESTISSIIVLSIHLFFLRLDVVFKKVDLINSVTHHRCSYT